MQDASDCDSDQVPLHIGQGRVEVCKLPALEATSRDVFGNTYFSPIPQLSTIVAGPR